MSWEDLIAQNNAASSPETDARIQLLQQQANGVSIENRTRQMVLDYNQQLGGAIGAAAASQPGSSSGQPSAGVFGNAPMTLDPRLDDPANAASASNAEGSGVATGDDGPGSGHQLNTAGAIAKAQQAYAPVLPNSYTPAEIQALKIATPAGNDAAVKFIQSQHSMKVDSANAAIQQRAQQEYNGLTGVVSAPDGRAMDALSLVEPGAAARLQADGATDAEVRQWATQLTPIVHRAARLPVEYGTDGAARDANTKEKIPGFDDYVGLSAQQRADLAKQATEKVDVIVHGSAEKQPRWQAEGADSAQDWLSQHVDMAEALRHGTGPAAAQVTPAPAVQMFRGPGNVAPNAGSPALPQTLPPGAVPGSSAGPTVPVQRPTLQGPVPTPAQQQAPRQVPQPGQGPQTPQQQLPTNHPPIGYDFSEAPAKPAYLDTGNRMPNEAEKAQTTDYVKAQTSLLQDANQSVEENQRALTESARMLSLLPNAKVGPGSAFVAKVQNAWSMLTGAQAADMIESNSTAYNLLAKKLGQSALSEQLTKLKSEGAQVRLGAQESGLILNTLSASPEMGKGAIDQLLRWQIAESDYSLHKAQAVRPYLAAGKDATQFDTWYGGRYPMQSNVPTGIQKPPASTPNASSKPDAGGFVVGKTYRDSKSGQTATYKGNGQWQ
jgi:hypothetical protein